MFVLSVQNQKMFGLSFRRRSFVKYLRNAAEWYHALVVNRIAYCLSAWGGFLSVEDENRINACFQRAERYGFTDTVYNVVGLREHSDRMLFKSLQTEGHCLASILPPVRSNIDELRNRGHIFTLPKCSTVAYKNSYLPRCLYNFI
jgi:hypothetical protein